MDNFELYSCKRKKRFRNKKRAKQAIERLKEIFKADYRPQYIYFCQFCQGYHLTSRSDFKQRGNTESLFDSYWNCRPLDQ